MRTLIVLAALGMGLGACGHVSEYESQVYDWEPVYCYRTLGAVECKKTPDRNADGRLVNYYGPDPSRTEAPEKPEFVQPAPPPAIDHWVKDPEPIPQAAPDANLSERPWRHELAPPKQESRHELAPANKESRHELAPANKESRHELAPLKQESRNRAIETPTRTI